MILNLPKKILLLLFSTTVAATFLVLTGVGGLLASPPESEELSVPAMSPHVITPDIPTFVTLTVNFSQNPNLKSPALQVFDLTRHKWKTVAKFSDIGKLEDTIKKDGIYNLRLRFLDSNGTMHIHLPQKQKLKLLWESANPLLRLVAKKKGQRGVVVSPTFSVSSVPPIPVIIGGATSGPPAMFLVPQSFDTSLTDNPDNVLLTKDGPNGYNLTVTTFDNPAGTALKDWVNAQFFGYNKIDSDSAISPITVAGLQGLLFDSSDESSDALIVWLDDPSNSRVYYFKAAPQSGGQSGAFADNTDEIMATINSFLQLQP